MADSKKTPALGCSGMLVLALLVTAIGRRCGGSGDDDQTSTARFTGGVLSAEATPAPVTRAAGEPTPTPERKWYQGGTLQNAGALTWQEADARNKLATAADLLAKLWMSKKLKPKVANRIRSVDDLMGPSAELVEGLNKAMEKQADPKINRQIYTNQKVSEIAVLVLMNMGWV